MFNMKTILFFSFFFFGTKCDLVSDINCDTVANAVIQPTKTNQVFIDWSESLSGFRKALLSGGKVTVKSFFEFPIENPGNDIWFVADTRNVMKMDNKKIVPFQESDFDHYYSSILPLDFRRTLEQIDISKLAKDKSTETNEIIIVSPVKSKMKATYSESAKTITLSLINNSVETGQFIIDYHFKILPDGNIKFSHVKFII